MEFTEGLPFAEALAKLGERGVLPADFDTYQWSLVPTEIRERAFFSSRVESATLLDTMKRYMDNYLAGARDENGHLVAQGRSEFVADMRELAIREGLGQVDAETGEIIPEIRESDLTDIRSIARLQLIFDTQVEAAQEYGYWLQGQHPDVLRAFPCSRFIRVRPVMMPRDYHAANEGVVRRKDDLDFWLDMNRDFGVPWGPWGFGSGMGVEDVGRSEAIELGIITADTVVKPVVEQFNKRLQAGVKSMDPGIAAALRRATGGSLAEGGRLTVREVVADSAPKRPRLPGLMEAVPVPERISPASAKIVGLNEHPDAAILQATASVIDSVHDDGGLSPVKLFASAATKNVGEYEFSQSTGRPLSMTISTAGPWPEITYLHENAHWMDQQIFGGRDGFGTRTGKWGGMIEILTKGETAKEIRRMIQSERRFRDGPKDLWPWMVADLKRMLKPEEMFARAYTQWITTKSAHQRLELLLKEADAHYFGIHNLKEADFAKFDAEITNQFVKRGWLTKGNN
jgi:hypothetical protein